MLGDYLMALCRDCGGRRRAQGDDPMEVVHTEAAVDVSRSGADIDRLPWPAAALAIAVLSLAGWAGFALVARLLLG
jgi:hypothetical protein